MLKTSLIINTYNYPAALDCVLTEVIRQVSASKLSCEILIADDGSGAPTQAIIDKHKAVFPALKHVWHEDLGFRRTVILNKAISESTGEYIIFLDGDCMPFPGFLTQHVALAEPGYFVAGHRVLASQDFTQHYLCADKKSLRSFSFFQWLSLFLKKQVNKLFPIIKNTYVLSFLKMIQHPYWRTTDWKFPKGCHFAVFKKDLFTVCGFDESFTGWGHEDSDLFIRLLHAGVKIKNGKFFVSVLHLWHPSGKTDKTNPNYIRMMQRAADPSVIQAQKGLSYQF